MPANVAEARQWIADWEEKTGGDEFANPPENVVEARRWIEDWKEGQKDGASEEGPLKFKGSDEGLADQKRYDW